MRFNNYLNEKLNLNYKLGEIYDSMDQWEAEFEVGDIEYTFTAEKFYIEDSPDLMDYLGYEFNPKSPDDYKGNEAIWDIEFKQDSWPKNLMKGQYDITGEAGSKSLKVFSAVATALKTFLLRKKPNHFTFSAKESSRQKLYDRFSKIIPKISKIYKSGIVRTKGDKVFIFSKKAK